MADSIISVAIRPTEYYRLSMFNVQECILERERGSKVQTLMAICASSRFALVQNLAFFEAG